MSDAQVHFQPGQLVAWREAENTRMKKYGPGPFTILSVEDIPEDLCCCGGSLNDQAHASGCPHRGSGYGTVRESVGHPQWVTLADREGNPLTTTACGRTYNSRFSGMFFKNLST
jgi:hypothetical protein